MNRYRVKICGQFEYTTYVDAGSPEEARDDGEVDLDHEMRDVEVVIINSTKVEQVVEVDNNQRGEAA